MAINKRNQTLGIHLGRPHCQLVKKTGSDSPLPLPNDLKWHHQVVRAASKASQITDMIQMHSKQENQTRPI